MHGKIHDKSIGSDPSPCCVLCGWCTLENSHQHGRKSRRFSEIGACSAEYCAADAQKSRRLGRNSVQFFDAVSWLAVYCVAASLGEKGYLHGRGSRQFLPDMILTVAVVTKPLRLERKDVIAEKGIEALRSEVDSLITIPNQKLSEVFGGECDFTEAFAHGNDVLLGAVRGISDIITKVGTVNVDFQDVKTVMSEQGTAMMGTGIASGPSRALEAASAAVGSPLLEDINLENARGVLVNITGGEKVSIGEIEKVLEQIDQFAADDAMIIHGVAIDNSMEPGDLKVTIVATGLGSGKKKSNFGIDSMGNKNSSSVPSINTVKPINDLQDIEREASLDYLDVPSFVKRQID